MSIPDRYQRTAKKNIWTDTWLLEIIASVLSLLCLGVLVLVFVLADGKPTQVWHGLTLNTLVSILSTAARSAALLSLSSSISQWRWCLFKTQHRSLADFECYDTASRGPFGCLMLIWKTKKSSWVWLGALTVILGLAFEPFSQQLVQYGQSNDCQDSTLAQVPRAQRYSRGLEYGLQTGSLDEAHEWTTADFSMQSAILYGLNEPLNRVSQQLPVHCPTQNCTWPKSYESLAICSSCKDLSGQLKRSEVNSQLASLLEVDNGAATASPGAKFALSNGLYLDGQDGWLYDPVQRNWTGNTKAANDALVEAVVLMTSFGTGQPGLTNTMHDADTLIWSESVIRIKPDISDPRLLSWPDLPLEATECSLYYCVNRYETSVTNGTLVEAITEQPSLRRNPASWALLPGERAKLGQLNMSVSTAESLVYNERYSTVARSDLMLGDIFNVSQNAVDSISAFMKKLFATDMSRFTDDQVTGLNGWYIDDGQEQYFPSVTQRLRDASDLSDVFQSVAVSMSNAIRIGSDGGLMENGQLCEQTMIYRIEWAWIALPAGIVLASIAQLLLSVTWTARSQTPLWKCSSLAILSRGFYTDGILSEAQSLSQMEACAQTSAVTLFPDLQLLPSSMARSNVSTAATEASQEEVELKGLMGRSSVVEICDQESVVR